MMNMRQFFTLVLFDLMKICDDQKTNITNNKTMAAWLYNFLIRIPAEAEDVPYIQSPISENLNLNYLREN